MKISNENIESLKDEHMCYAKDNSIDVALSTKYNCVALDIGEPTINFTRCTNIDISRGTKNEQ